MFDKDVAKEHLEEDRKKYVDKCMKILQQFVESEMYEFAADIIIQAGNDLKSLNGAMQYVTCMNDDYPRFNTILGD